MKAALVLIAVLLLVSLIDEAFGAYEASYWLGLNPARVWFARPGAIPKGSVIVPREDCAAAVVEQKGKVQLPATLTHCARV